jgi:hypothetical protein
MRRGPRSMLDKPLASRAGELSRFRDLTTRGTGRVTAGSSEFGV